jgi:hypothetical protein
MDVTVFFTRPVSGAIFVSIIGFTIWWRIKMAREARRRPVAEAG